MIAKTPGQQRIVPTWVIVVDNAPTVVMFFLGSALVWKIGPVYSVLFLAYCFLSIFLFWRLICPWCSHFGTSGCPCGYGMVAARLFKRRSGRDFKRVFKQNIGVVFPCWFIPSGVGIWLLWTEFGWGLFILFLSFCVVGFALIPALSKFVGCRRCTLKDECPWISRVERRQQEQGLHP